MSDMTLVMPDITLALANAKKAEFTELLIQAGAGAGKTTELVSRILSFLIHARPGDNPPPRIAVTTFTRKATEELRERILFAVSGHPDPRLLQICQDQSKLWITTIHGIYSEILRTFGHHLGWGGDFTVIDDFQAFQWKKTIFFEYLETQSTDAFRELLGQFRFPELLEILESYRAFLLQNEDGEMPTEVHHRDYQMRARALTQASLEFFIDSMEKLKLTAKQGESLAALRTVLAEIESARDIRVAWSALWGFRAPKDLAESWAVLKPRILGLIAEEFSEEFFHEHSLIAQNFADFFEAFDAFETREMQREQILTQGQLERLAFRLLRDYREVREKFREAWDVWLIDEYQDTSELQEKFLNLLTEAKKTFVVGDPQQSIYYFRGADVSVFENKKQQFSAFEVRDKNYRSLPKLVDFFNRFFGYLNPQNALPMSAHRTGDDGFDLAVFRGEEESLALRQAIEQLAAGEGTKAVLCRKNSEVVAISNLLGNLGIKNVTSGGQFEKRRVVQDALAVMEWLLAPNDHELTLNLLRSPWINITDDEIFDLVKMRKEKQTSWAIILNNKNLNDPIFGRNSVRVLQTLLDERTNADIFELWLWALRECQFFSSCAILDPSGKVECSLWQLVNYFESERQKPGFQVYESLRAIPFQRIVPVSLGHEDAVQVMTIHASKGLEFDHVLLPFLGKAIRAQASPIFVSLPEQKIWGLRIRSESSDSAKAALPYFQDAIAAEKLIERGESHRLLYVAMTRSKKSLLFVSSAKPDKMSWGAQIFDFLDKTPDALRVVDVTASQDIKPPDLSQELSLDTAEIEFRPFSPRLSPVTKEFQIELTPQTAARVRAGISFHQMIARLRSKAIQRPEFKFLKTSRDVPSEEIFRSGYFEWPFTIWDEASGSVQNGRIDLWAEIGDNVWIVDYKTGEFFDDLDFTQLQNYEQALRKVFEFEAKSFYGVYIQPNQQKVRVKKL